MAVGIYFTREEQNSAEIFTIQLVIRSDNGPQMTSHVFMDHVGNFGEDQVLHELIPPATPNENAHIKAFIIQSCMLNLFNHDISGIC